MQFQVFLAIGVRLTSTATPTVCLKASMEVELAGLEADFVEETPKIYECPVCLLVLREPYMLSCCGVKVCHVCISRIQNASGNVCPLCRETFTAMMDKQLNRLILDLAVRCPLKAKGCKWVGELRQVNGHTDPNKSDGCQYVDVPCGNLCGGVFPRYSLSNHQEESCPKRQKHQQTTDKKMMETFQLAYSQLKREYDHRLFQVEETVKALKKEVSELKSATSTEYEKHLQLKYSPEVLTLIPNLEDITKLVYYPKKGHVRVEIASTPDARLVLESSKDKMLTSTNTEQSFKRDIFQLQSSFKSTEARRITNELREICPECTLTYISSSHSIEIISSSVNELEEMKEIIRMHIARIQASSSTHVATTSKVDLNNIKNTMPPRPTALNSKFSANSGTNKQQQYSPTTHSHSSSGPLAGTRLSGMRSELDDAANNDTIRISERRCPLCLSTSVIEPVCTRCCSKTVCRNCIDRSLQQSPHCPFCGVNIGGPIRVGSTPTILSCLVCGKTVMTDAVPTICCGRFFCRKCLEQALELSPFCPSCNATVRSLTTNEKVQMTKAEVKDTSSSGPNPPSKGGPSNIQSMMKVLGFDEEKKQQLANRMKKTFGYKEKQETGEDISKLTRLTCANCGEQYFSMPSSPDDMLCEHCKP